MKRLNDLFEVSYGNKFDLNKMHILPRTKGGIDFVGRSSENHGVAATVNPIKNVQPYPAGLITVALGGTKLLSSFIHQYNFYTAQNVAVLTPRSSLTFEEKLYVCLCIRQNRFRYSAFGREANRTLKELMIPDLSEFPIWTADTFAVEDGISAPSDVGESSKTLDSRSWKAFQLQELFEIKKGKRLTKADMKTGRTPFIGAIDSNNGLTGFIDKPALHQGNTITVNYNGNGVADAFYQPIPFWCSDDVNVLYPRFKMSPEAGLFIATVIRMEKYRFSYGRKWNLGRMNVSVIRLPATPDNKPDCSYMESFMRQLPYSSQLSNDGREPLFTTEHPAATLQ